MNKPFIFVTDKFDDTKIRVNINCIVSYRMLTISDVDNNTKNVTRINLIPNGGNDYFLVKEQPFEIDSLIENCYK